MGKVIPLVFLIIGLFFLVQVFYPLISYKLWEFKSVTPQFLISPQDKQGREVLGISIRQDDNFPAFFSTLKRESPTPYNEFTISVPALKIETVKVFVDSNDLNLGLVHLPGSSLPGEKGNVFISGHSALPITIRDKKSISFARLNDLKKGDKIEISAGGDFKYEVVDLKIVNPKDVSVIFPPDKEGRYITLMTCVPPGLNTKRLVVLGKMI